MQPLPFFVHGWSAWPATNPDQTVPSSIPSLLRRRVTPIGQRGLAAAWSLPDIDKSRLILSSRHGEMDRTLSILTAIAEGQEVSPADFTLSVHHALIGLLSIVQKNRRGHSAVAAGSESFCMGLLEAAACLKDNPAEPVMLLHFDAPLPQPLSDFEDERTELLALALALGAQGPGDRVELSFTKTSAGTTPSLSHATDFLTFLEQKAEAGQSVGQTQQWRWARHGSV